MLGDKVKELRKGRKITQQELANAIGLSQSTIGMIEGNKQGASNETLLKLANVLDTTIDYLLSGEDNNEYIDNILPKLNNKDEKDIAKKITEALDVLESEQDGLMFDGTPIDDETKELLKISLENSMKLAKQIAKQKYTPNKYKK